MRMIGELKDEAHARTFGDYLYTQGIGNEIERDRDGTSAIWVHDDDHLDRAKTLLDKFKTDPTNRDYQGVAEAATRKRKQEEKELEAVQKRTHTRDEIFPTGIAPLTLILMIASIFAFVRADLMKDQWMLSKLLISTQLGYGFLNEVRAGEVWRLVTPIFLHFGPMHILFNMLMLKDCGTLIERRHSAFALGLFVVVVGIGSNVLQYFFSGPLFGGMSGVVYGLFGYLWLRGKFDPNWSLHLSQFSIILLMVWYFAGFLDFIPGVRMANFAHLGGLVLGGTWGFLTAYGWGGKLFK